MRSAFWQLDGTAARLQHGPLSATLDVSRPHRGLGEVQLDGKNLETRLFQIDSLPRTADTAQRDLEDAYVRDADLVATYRESPQFPIRTQIYWRVLLPGAATLGGVELVVSAQTNVLDSNPRMIVTTRARSTELLRLADESAERFLSCDDASTAAVEAYAALPSVYLLRLATGTISLVQMIHPLDDLGAQVTQDVPTSLGQPSAAGRIVALRHSIFRQQLEKGVLLRARLRGIFVPRAGDEAAAVRCYRDLLDAPLPLTV
jgi:hypothetical protein